MLPAATYAARLSEAVATYEAAPSPATYAPVAALATTVRRRWPEAVLLLPLPPAPTAYGKHGPRLRLNP
ncbi:hypothetical protein [Hymenobacter ruber]